MDRRGFLHTLMGAAVAAQQLDIEKLLWTPGKKTIFIPIRNPDGTQKVVTATEIEARWREAERQWATIHEQARIDLAFFVDEQWRAAISQRNELLDDLVWKHAPTSSR